MSMLHDYLEFNINIWEKIAYLDMTYVKSPKWWAKMWSMPESSWKVPGKNLAYHVGHVSAAGSVVAVGIVSLILIL
jgi:hypothetical protein